MNAYRRGLLAVAALAPMGFGLGCRQRIEVTESAPPVPRESVDIQRPPYITWDRQPTVADIPGTGVSYLVEFDKEEIYRVGGKWYRFYHGHWFVSAENWKGPWLATTDVPAEFLKIPRTHPRYRIVRQHPDYRKP